MPDQDHFPIHFRLLSEMMWSIPYRCRVPKVPPGPTIEAKISPYFRITPYRRDKQDLQSPRDQDSQKRGVLPLFAGVHGFIRAQMRE
jgi:hypothetical protein